MPSTSAHSLSRDKLADAGRGKDLELWRDFLRDAQQRGDDDDGKDGGSGGKNNA